MTKESLVSNLLKKFIGLAITLYAVFAIYVWDAFSWSL